MQLHVKIESQPEEVEQYCLKHNRINFFVGRTCDGLKYFVAINPYPYRHVQQVDQGHKKIW